MTQYQTLAVGQTLTDKYGGLGGITGVAMIPGPSHLHIGLVSKQGMGKTTFLTSNPKCFILNVDGSPSTVLKPNATLWPGVTEDGQTVRLDENGKLERFKLTWSTILELEKKLLDLAERNAERPSCIAIDSLTTAYRLLQEWVVENAQRLGITSGNPTSFHHLHGQTAYPAVWDEYIRFCLSLKSAGYGVITVMHLVDHMVTLNDQGMKRWVENDPSISGGFQRSLWPLFDMVAAISTKRKTIKDPNAPEFIEVKVGDKVVKQRNPNIKSISVKERYLIVDNEEMDGTVKKRIKMPGEIRISELNGWADFEQAYLDSRMEKTPNE